MGSREDYIAKLQRGDLVAFKTSSLEAKMYSGKITKLGSTKVEVETKNGKKYFVNKENIFWVNINGKWPSHILQALKGIDDIEPEVEDEEIVEVVEEVIEPDESAIVVEDGQSGIIVDVIEEVECLESEENENGNVGETKADDCTGEVNGEVSEQ